MGFFVLAVLDKLVGEWEQHFAFVFTLVDASLATFGGDADDGNVKHLLSELTECTLAEVGGAVELVGVHDLSTERLVRSPVLDLTLSATVPGSVMLSIRIGLVVLAGLTSKFGFSTASTAHVCWSC